MDEIKYTRIKKIKYQLFKSYEIQTKLVGFEGRVKQYGLVRITLSKTGLLRILKGYFWDGASSIARDTLTIMRPSLVHDALYGLLREKILPMRKRRYADSLFRKLCLKDGMLPPRADYLFLGIRAGGRSSAQKQKPFEVQTAPRIRRKKNARS